MEEDDRFALPEGMTDPMFWKLCDLNMGLPVPLETADLSKPFIYDRRWGVFHTPMGAHQGGMSLLLAWQKGHKSGYAVAEAMGLEFSSGTADYWLEHTPGTAFRSSVGKKILVAKLSNLNILERRIFGAEAELMELMPDSLLLQPPPVTRPR